MTTPAHTVPRLMPLLALFAAMVIGGVGNTATASQAGDPALFLGFRFGIAALMFAYWIPQIRKLPPILIVASGLEAFSVAALILAMGQANVAAVSTILALGPLLALAINRMTGRQPLAPSALIPMGLGLLSAVLVSSERGGSDKNMALGIGLAVLCTVLSTVGTLLNGWYGTHVSTWVRASTLSLFGTLIFLPFLIGTVVTEGPKVIHLDLIAVAAFTALLPGGLAKVMILYSLKTVPVPLTMAANTVAVVTAALSAWLFLHQSLPLVPTLGVAVGMAATVALAIVLVRQARSSRPSDGTRTTTPADEEPDLEITLR